MIEKIDYLWIKELSDLSINKETWVRCTTSKLITWIWLADIWENSYHVDRKPNPVNKSEGD